MGCHSQPPRDEALSSGESTTVAVRVKATSAVTVISFLDKTFFTRMARSSLQGPRGVAGAASVAPDRGR